VRLLIVFCPLAWLVLAPSSNQAQRPAHEAAFEQTVLPFIAENCAACHNAKKPAGGLNLEEYKTAASVAEHREKWENILLKMQTGEMPPKGMPRPPQAEVEAVTRWIEGEFERADKLMKPDPGRVTARRLNRAEYNNTVRDLLGVDFKPADDFPQDDSGYGFDNIGDVLSLSPALMEKYLAAAEKVARAAVFGPEPLKPTLTKLRAGERKITPVRTPFHDYDQTGLSLPNAFHVTYRFPVDGEYVFRVYPGGSRPLGSEPLQIGLWVDGKLVASSALDAEKTASFDIDRQEFGGKSQEFRARLEAGDHWVAATILNIYEGLPARYQGPKPSTRPEPPPPEFKPPRAGIPPERLALFKKRFEERIAENAKMPVNDVRLGSLEIGGPYSQTPGPSAESRQKVFVCGHADGKHESGCAQKIVRDLARRAYRRPVTPAEVNQLAGLVALARRQGDSFEEGVNLAIQAMLVSPHFLFRIEQDRTASAASSPTAADLHPINNHELASRLSYFLWSTMPDDELLRAADEGKLREPAVLEAQVRRMLKDPKARALAENFGGQWLELRKLEAVKPDRERFPQFEEYLRMSMRLETELFFDHIAREDASILDFIDGNYTFLNERLAKFYQIPGVKGPEFRRVTLPADMPRGGVLTQASVLTVSSYSTRTSPVLRGKWILDNILNAPPPPAPPGVPNLDEEKVGSSASLRQQLEEHRRNPTCASCHARMDPLGFGLENFDAIGAWREKDGNFPVDAAGTLPNGRSFKGPRDLLAIIKSDREAFTQGLTEKLLTYALGRGLERYDKPTVKKIAKNVAARDHRFSGLVLEIVGSLPFQMRRAAPKQAVNEAVNADTANLKSQISNLKSPSSPATPTHAFRR
jgi:mono/diheme cytochrome c family protein